MSEPLVPPTASTESPWLVWGRCVFALTIVAILLALGVANIGTRARWHEVEDGVLWAGRAEGVTALEVARGSAADAAGIHRGDVLLAVNGSPVQTPADVVEFQHRGHEGTRLAYTLLRLGTQEALELSLAPAPRASSMYFVLAAVGLFTLVVGASVRLRRPRDQATLHFFWLCVAFFGAFTFSFNGPLDRLDWIFYWGDVVAMALLPPLLLHFTIVFPERPGLKLTNARPRTEWVVPLIYVPALVLGAARVFAVARGSSQGELLSSAINVLDRGEQLYLFVCAVAALGVLVRAFQDITAAASLDCLGDRARRRTLRVLLCPAVGARRRSAARPAVDRHSARPGPADLRVRHRALPPARCRSDREARPRVHGLSRGQRRALFRDAEADGFPGRQRW